MNDSIKRISLDLHATSSRETVKVKRIDTGRKIYVSLVDGGVPYHITEDCYAVFTGKKPDGNILFNDCTIEGNVIIYKLTEQTAAVPGLVSCEIKLYGADAQLITSPKFNIMVDDTVYDEGDEIESTDEFSALTALVAEVQELKAELEESGGITDEQVKNAVDAYLEENPFEGGSTLIVTVENDVASHTPTEINAHVQAGGNVVLSVGGDYIPLANASSNASIFGGNIDIEHDLATNYVVYASKEVESFFTNYARTQEIPKTLIVTEQQDGTASHGPMEIDMHMRHGGTVVFSPNGDDYINLAFCNQYVASFVYSSIEENIFDEYIIYQDGAIETFSRTNADADQVVQLIKDAMSTQIPYFDLASIGLPAIVPNGEYVRKDNADTDAIRDALSNGIIKIGVKINVGMEVDCYAIPNTLIMPVTGIYQLKCVADYENVQYVVSCNIGDGFIAAAAIPLANDAHINSLIDTKLGVIENGSY